MSKDEVTDLAIDPPPKFDRNTGETVFTSRLAFVKIFQKYKREVLDQRLLSVDIGNRASLRKKYELFASFITSGDQKERFIYHALKAGFGMDKANEYLIELEGVIIPDFKEYLANGQTKKTEEGEFRI